MVSYPQIQDKLYTGSGNPAVGAAVTLYPVAQPIMAMESDGLFHPLLPPFPSTITDNTGQFTISGFWPSQSDPGATLWVLVLPDGVWAGQFPEGNVGPFTLKTLKDSYGWGLVSGPAPGPIVTVQGPVGSRGPTTWKGAWQATTTYSVGDAVSYGASTYICIVGIAGNVSNSPPPSDTAHWDLMLTFADATTTAVGLVEVDHAPTGAHPVALTTDGQHALRHMPGAGDPLDMTKLNPWGATTTPPTLPNVLYPSGIYFQTSDHKLYQNQAGTWVQIGTAGVGDATTTSTGVVEVDATPSGTHPVALTTDGTHHLRHQPGGADALDLTTIIPDVSSLPGLPNSLYPAGILVIRTSDSTIWQNQAGTWTQIGGGAAAAATTTSLGDVLIDRNPASGNPVTLTKYGLLQAAAASATAPLVALGDGLFDGSGAAFLGSSTGTYLGGNFLASGTNYRQAVLADSPTHYYRFGAAAGSSSEPDLGSAGGALTYLGGAVLAQPGATGDGNTSVGANGTASVAQASTGTGFPTGTGAFTVECLVKGPTTPGDGPAFWGVGDVDAHDGSIQIGPSTSTFLFASWGGGGNADHITVSNPSDGNWHHLVFVWDGTNSKIYWDGAQVYSVSSHALNISWLSNFFAVGSAAQASRNILPAGEFVDEVAVYGSALSSTRIAAHYAAISVAGGASNDLTNLEVAGASLFRITGSGNLTVSGSIVSSTSISAPRAVLSYVSVLGGNLTLADNNNVVLGTGTGSQIGTATGQKLGFYGSTPIVQPANTTDLRTALVNLGLLASGGATPLNTNGGDLTVGNLTLGDGKNIIVGTTTGTKIGTSTTQKLGFFNSTPIVQPANTTDIRTALINLGLYATGGASPLNLNGGLLTAGTITSGQITTSAALTGTGSVLGGGLGNTTAPPLAASWTVVNAGGGSAINDGPTGCVNVVAPHTGAAAWRGWTQTWTAGKTLIVGLRVALMAATGQFPFAGVSFYDGTKLATFGIMERSGVVDICLQKWTNLTTWSADTLLLPIVPSGAFWLKIVDNGTNRLYSYSADGNTWVQVFSETNTTFLTPTTIGLWATADVASYDAAATCFHWSLA